MAPSLDLGLIRQLRGNRAATARSARCSVRRTAAAAVRLSAALDAQI